jgi:hypothetical protein
MDNAVISKMATDLGEIKGRIEAGSEIDVGYIIDLMAPYSKKDLRLFKDCIDFTLIYMER